jgi:hypothetical protein
MRFTILIISFCLSSLSFGQDSLHKDTTHITLASPNNDNSIRDSNEAAARKINHKEKKQRKKVYNKKKKEESFVGKEENPKNSYLSGNRDIYILIGMLVVGITIYFAYRRSPAKQDAQNSTSISSNDGFSSDDGFLSDYLSRMLLSRRYYYRNVYLKSEAWKRKRYLVLKRDNWRCVYCGDRATQVHHRRYAKRNIGKEPIDWLVSICKTCHESIH